MHASVRSLEGWRTVRSLGNIKSVRPRRRQVTTNSAHEQVAEPPARSFPASGVETIGRARSKASQGKGWSSVLNSAKRIVASRPNDHLSSILAELRELNISRKDPGRYYRVKDMVAPVGAAILGREGMSVDDGFYAPDVSNSSYRVSTISPIRYLSQLIRPDTTGVMEVGSGWSSNLFQLYIAYGASRAKKIVWYGGEYTKEGQICAKFIASREEAMKFRSFSFDYRNPDVTFLTRQRGHILLFTSHSIEQVDEINPNLFEQLRQIANAVTVVHFEPVGWQRFPELLKRREENDVEGFEAIGRRALAGDISSVAENAAWWSWRLEYNKNLLPIIRELQADGACRMVREAYDFSGHANVLNPSTLLHYEFVR
jgi:hypothetical protein